MDLDHLARNSLSPTACEETRPQLAAIALGTLDSDEGSDALRHLDRCPDCRHQLDDYHRIVDTFGLLVQPATPSPRLRARLLNALGHEGRPLFAGLRRWLLPIAAVLIVALVAGNVALWTRYDDARSQLDAIQRQRERVASAPLAWYDLTSSESTGSAARGTLCATVGGGVAWLIVEGLPQLPDGRVYQGWLNQGEARQSAGTFKVDDRGRGFLTIRLSQPIEDYETFGVTAEPLGGSPQPTGERYLRGSLRPSTVQLHQSRDRPGQW